MGRKFQDLAAVQVRKGCPGAGGRSDPESFRIVEQKDVTAGRRGQRREAVVEPAVQVLPFPVAQGLRHLVVEVAGGVGNVVVLQRHNRRGQAGAVGLAQCLVLLLVRHSGVVLGLAALPGLAHSKEGRADQSRDQGGDDAGHTAHQRLVPPGELA